tara:strand:+ start:491 stop:733 length:243 start_codon:yes stop_codon:yes gene_type:complete
MSKHIDDFDDIIKSVGKGDSDNPDVIDRKLINADALFEMISLEFRENPTHINKVRLNMAMNAILFWTSQSKKVFSLTEEF